jgi:hypothetical protein
MLFGRAFELVRRQAGIAAPMFLLHLMPAAFISGASFFSSRM